MDNNIKTWHQNNPEKIKEYNKKYISTLKIKKQEINNLKAVNYSLLQENKMLNKKINDLELEIKFYNN